MQYGDNRTTLWEWVSSYKLYSQHDIYKQIEGIEAEIWEFPVGTYKGHCGTAVSSYYYYYMRIEIKIN